MVFHTDRKRFANGFPLDMTPLCFIPTGNCSRIVSCPTWLHCVSHRQETFRREISRLRFAALEMTGAAGRHCASYRRETVREWFPIRHDTFVLHAGRKLFANGFLSDMISLCFMPAGNCSRIVSCPTWLHCVSHRQETFRREISRLRFAALEMTGAAGRHCASYRRETVCEWFPIRHDTFVFHSDRKLLANSFPLDMTPLCFIPTGNRLRMVSHST